jgi:hypothetical protein
VALYFGHQPAPARGACTAARSALNSGGDARTSAAIAGSRISHCAP